MSTSLPNRLPLLALWMLLAFGLTAPGAHADDYEFRFPDGSAWRGGLEMPVTVVFVENGVSQEMSGVLVGVRGDEPGFRIISIRGEIAGSTATKSLFESDIRSMTSGDGGGLPEEQPTRKPAVDPDRSSDSGRGGAKAGSSRRGGSIPAGPKKNADGHLVADKPGVFFLPWEGQVGTLARHESIEQIAEEADRYGPGQIIVLHINSPGGLVMEGDEISETLLELKQRHRVVAWIKKAISAGAFTALHCDEIYFERVGTMGSAVMFAGTKSIEGAQLDAWVGDFGDIAEEGGRDRIPAECMVTRTKMASDDKDPETGEITWYPDMRGEFAISNGEQVLTLNSSNAFHSGYIDGIADTEEELAVLLDLPEWYEITDRGREIHAKWHRLCERCTKDVKRIGRELQLRPEKRLVLLEELLAWYGRCEPVMLYDLGAPGGGEDELRRAIERERRARARNRR